MFDQREPSIEAIRSAATDSNAVRLRYGSSKKTVLMDRFTASAIVAVYDVINADNQAKFGRMIATRNGLEKVSAFCLSKVSGRA